MKRLFDFVFILILASLFSIFPLGVDYATADENNANGKDQAGSIIDPPIVISSSYYDIDGDGNKETIEILQTKGKFIDGNADTPWCGGRDRWQGDFIIRVLKNDKLLSEQSLSDLFGAQYIKDAGYLSFWAPKFQLVFKDYNNDGQIDFNLGQYGVCDGNNYYLFTIDKKGKINRLPFDDDKYGGLYVQGGESHDNSTNKISSEKGVIKRDIFNRFTDVFVTTVYKWSVDKFIIDEEIREPSIQPAPRQRRTKGGASGAL